MISSVSILLNRARVWLASLRPWHAFVLLRIIMTLYVQPGYIHPDEYFQSVEVVSGDVFGIDVHKTWEFDEKTPIRSMALNIVIYVPAYITYYILTKINVCQVDTFSLQVAPRISILLLSLYVDGVVYKILKNCRGLHVDSAMLVYTTSYITLVYYTRTLSNTIESFLFITLIYFVQSETQRIQRFFTTNPRSKLTQCSRADDTHALRVFEWICPANAFAIATCLVAGFFNRPTFLIFAYVPFLYYLFDGIMPQNVSDFFTSAKVAMRKFWISLCFCFPLVVIFIHADTVYYKDWSDIINTHDLPFIENIPSAVYNFVFRFAAKDLLAITPLNFIDYNMKSENLAEHGTHSRFTHYFVNQPLLFGTLFFCVLFDTFVLITTKQGTFRVQRTSALEEREMKFWLHTYLLPLVLLSLFPHQEPRFLLPLLLPLVVLYGYLIFGSRSRKFYTYPWIILNITGVLFYGYLHQSGVVKSIDFMRKHVLINTDDASVVHVIYSHTYMPPRHLFLRHSESIMMQNDFSRPVFSQQSISSQRLLVHDLQGRPVYQMEERISEILQSKHFQGHIYVVMPSTLELSLCLNSSLTHEYKFVKQFARHLSMEEPPGRSYLRVWSDRGFPCSLCKKDAPCKLHPFHIFSPLLGLNVYRVHNK